MGSASAQNSTKPAPAYNIERIKRVIELEGIINVLLVIALAGVLIWFLRLQRLTTVSLTADEFNPPIRITMPLYIYDEDKTIVWTSGTVHKPIISIYGKVEDYASLTNALDGFSVLIQKTTVTPKPQTGEFAERFVLKPGVNTVDVSVRWNGQEHYHTQYFITYSP